MSYSEAKSSILGGMLLAREVGFGGGTGTECHLFCWEKSGLLLEKASYFRLNGGTVGERMS